MNCKDCGHVKGKCDCLCCCAISKMGCPSCIIPMLCYRGIKKLIRIRKELKNRNDAITSNDVK